MCISFESWPWIVYLKNSKLVWLGGGGGVKVYCHYILSSLNNNSYLHVIGDHHPHNTRRIWPWYALLKAQQEERLFYLLGSQILQRFTQYYLKELHSKRLKRSFREWLLVRPYYSLQDYINRWPCHLAVKIVNHVNIGIWCVYLMPILLCWCFTQKKVTR